jgi:hypothetical protein
MGIRTLWARGGNTMEKLQLNIQLFADETEPTEPTTQEPEEKQLSFDDILGSNKDYQSEFDRRISKALDTAKEKWVADYSAKLEQEKTEAEKLAKMNAEQKLNYELKKTREELAQKNSELNSITLYKQASQIALEKDLPVEYLDLIDFGKQSAETINSSIDKLVEIRNKDMEKYLNGALKEKQPYQRKQERQELDPFLVGFNSYFE